MCCVLVIELLDDGFMKILWKCKVVGMFCEVFLSKILQLVFLRHVYLFPEQYTVKLTDD